MIEINDNKDIDKLKNINFNIDKSNILYISHDCQPGGGQLFIKDIMESLEDKMDCWFLSLQKESFDWKSIVDIEKSIIFKNKNLILENKKEFVSFLSKFEFIHSTNYDFSFWDNLEFKERIQTKTIFSFLGDPSLKYFRNPVNGFDIITSNRINVRGKVWLPVPINFKKYNLKEFNKIFKETRDKYNISYETFVISMNSYFMEFKNQKFIIDVLNKLRSLDIKVFLVGNTLEEINGEFNKVMNKIKEYQLEDKVVITGEQKDVYPFLIASNLYLHPSFNEGMSRSICEAMFMKVPVLARRRLCNGIHEKNKTMFCFNDLNDCCEIVQRIYKEHRWDEYTENRETFKIINDAYDVVKYFDIENLKGKYYQFYINKFDFVEDFFEYLEKIVLLSSMMEEYYND